jgi:hypothetical protein
MTSYTRRRRTLPDDEIIKLYVDEQLDSDTVGAKAGCSSSTVLSLVRQAGGIIRPPGGKRRNPSLLIPLSEIIRRYREGQTGPKIAQAAATSSGTIYRLLRNAGVTIRETPSLAVRRKNRADE